MRKQPLWYRVLSELDVHGLRERPGPQHNLSTAYSMSSTHNAEQTLATEEIDVPQRYIWHNGSSKPKHNGASNHVQPDLLKILLNFLCPWCVFSVDVYAFLGPDGGLHQST